MTVPSIYIQPPAQFCHAQETISQARAGKDANGVCNNLSKIPLFTALYQNNHEYGWTLKKNEPTLPQQHFQIRNIVFGKSHITKIRQIYKTFLFISTIFVGESGIYNFYVCFSFNEKRIKKFLS